jgi:hypothetical protein
LVILGLWIFVELLMALRRLNGRRPARQIRTPANGSEVAEDNGSVASQSHNGPIVIGSDWRPGVRLYVFVLLLALVFIALVILTGGIALIGLPFVLFPWFATNQNTKSDLVMVDGKPVRVKYWIKRSRIWLWSHRVGPRSLISEGRLMQIFISQDGKLHRYRRSSGWLLFFTSDPEIHDLSQFAGGSADPWFSRLSVIWSTLLGLTAPFGSVKVEPSNKDKILLLEGIFDPTLVGNLLTSDAPPAAPQPAPPAIASNADMVTLISATVVATVEAMRRAESPDSHQ